MTEHASEGKAVAPEPGKGRPMVRAEGWEVCAGSTSGNDGRPFRLRRWVGEQA